MKYNSTKYLLRARYGLFQLLPCRRALSTSHVFLNSPPLIVTRNDLKVISDLSQPHNWYPLAREVKRRIIFHAGPTNSGKTYEALQRFKQSKCGVYCGPLRLLASEVYNRLNSEGIHCDLVTGEDRKYAIDSQHPVEHLSCTVEMLNVSKGVEVIVIDEIQMLRDLQRGWAWTRALLGAPALEVHLCGETAAIPIVQRLLAPIGEQVEVREYERKSELVIAKKSLKEWKNVQPGDCIVAFSKTKIYDIARELEKEGTQCALIYGDLPPDTKRAQSDEFNNPDSPIKVLVATDAVGMGLNLNIRRVIFENLRKRARTNEFITAAQAKQIAGRAGRFNTEYAVGEVTTLNEYDMPVLRSLLSQSIPNISQAGIAPTADMLETFSFYLPKASFCDLLKIFQRVCNVSENFFLSEFDQVLERAKLIDDIAMPLNTRYTFCKVPFDPSQNRLAGSMLVKMVRLFSEGRMITGEWLQSNLNWPKNIPRDMSEFVTFEQLYTVLDCYLWLSMRYEAFCDGNMVRALQADLATKINGGIKYMLSRQKSSEFDPPE